MDAFFASVEQRLHPEWRGKTVIVGAGPRERGVVSTCSYEARTFGVRSAMPSRTAYERCPGGIFVKPHMSAYKMFSERAFEIFSHYSPYVEAVSIDEAFLDITGTLHKYASPVALGEALRDEIRTQLGITCSVGIATNRLLAKIGSEQHKPDGLTLMPSGPDAIARFLAPKPLDILWGVGKHMAETLGAYSLVTCGDIQNLAEEKLAAILGISSARELKDYAVGISDDTVYWEPTDEKSVSREHTFDTDELDRAKIRAKLIELVGEVGRRFRRETRWARTAKIKLRDASFNTVTRQMPFERPARDDITFREKALELFDREKLGAIRLIGFGVTNLVDSPDDNAPLLFADAADVRREKRERLSETLDDLHSRGLM